MELDAIYCAVTIIQIIQIEVNHLELFKCPFEYSSAIQIAASRQQKTEHHNKLSQNILSTLFVNSFRQHFSIFILF